MKVTLTLQYLNLQLWWFCFLLKIYFVSSDLYVEYSFHAYTETKKNFIKCISL